MAVGRPRRRDQILMITDFNIGITTAASLAESLGGVAVGRGRWRAHCPAHGGFSLQITEGETQLLFKCWAGCSFEEVTTALRDQRVNSQIRFFRQGTSVQDDEARSRSIDAARAIYEQAQPAAGTAAETYLRSRGSALPVPQVLRFHAQAPHRAGWYYPAMAAPVVDISGEQIGIHLTYLSSDGRTKHTFA